MRIPLKLAILATVVVVPSLVVTLAQQRSAVPDPVVHHIGFLGLRPIVESAPQITALNDSLRELGYLEGKNLVVNVRLADNDPRRYPVLIDELTKLDVKLIVAASTPAGVAIQKSNPNMAVVVRGPDLVGAGLAVTAKRPGGRATGIEELAEGLADKRLRLLKQAVPAISRVAVLSSAPTESGHAMAFADAERTAKDIGVTLRNFKVSATTNVEAIFEEIAKANVDALFCPGGVLPRPVEQQIVNLAAKHRLPAIYAEQGFVDMGGLMTFAYRSPDMFRVAAAYVDKILKGASPGELPLTIWTKYYLTVNATTAASLGITFSPTLLSQVEQIVK